MSDNLRHWNALGKTDPAHTKPFQRAGGFRGTAIKPIWSAKMMTEHFGPVGMGWGMGKPEFTLVPAGQELLVYCTVSLWYTDPGHENVPCDVIGVGGDKVITKRRSGELETDDEAYKKAFTDALSNAMKFIGVGADVHMGLFDDSKYVSSLRSEFADEPANSASPAIAQEPPVKAPTPASAPRPATGELKALVANVAEKTTGKGPIWEITMANGDKGSTFNPDVAALATASKAAGEPMSYSINTVVKGKFTNHYFNVPEPKQKAAPVIDEGYDAMMGEP